MLWFYMRGIVGKNLGFWFNGLQDLSVFYIYYSAKNNEDLFFIDQILVIPLF